MKEQILIALDYFIVYAYYQTYSPVSVPILHQKLSFHSVRRYLDGIMNLQTYFRLITPSTLFEWCRGLF